MRTFKAFLLSSLVTLAVTASFATDTPAPTAETKALQAKLQEIASKHRGKVALYAENLKTGQSVAINADEVIQTASTIKLTALVEAAHQIKDGKKHLDDKVTLRQEDKVGGSGIFPFLRAPIQLSLEDVLSFMVIASDNTATNLAIDQLGLANINARSKALGLKDTYFYKKVYKKAEGPMPPDQKKFGLGKTTAREMAKVITSIQNCEVGDEALCKTMLGMLKNQIYRESIPRYTETSDTSEVPSAIANKTGALDALRADVAIVYTTSGPIVISAYTYENKDESWTPDNEGYLTIARMAKAIVETWAPKGLAPAKTTGN
ncbi:MAG: peptidase D-alanyl-D-alanine carboxypeptidase 1 [Acidobacteriales bacterium]|nr:peptidase D-alanyl-D-alanine carboxypeptidase 1 [Terriglobales bacterium]